MTDDIRIHRPSLTGVPSLTGQQRTLYFVDLEALPSGTGLIVIGILLLPIIIGIFPLVSGIKKKSWKSKLLREQPTDHDMDKWIDAVGDREWDWALEKLRLELDEDVLEDVKLEALVPTVDHTPFVIDGKQLFIAFDGVRVGADGVARSAVYYYSFMFVREEGLATYQSFYDVIEDVFLHEEYNRFYWKDIENVTFRDGAVVLQMLSQREHEFDVSGDVPNVTLDPKLQKEIRRHNEDSLRRAEQAVNTIQAMRDEIARGDDGN
jgi:hypothetical protein